MALISQTSLHRCRRRDDAEACRRGNALLPKQTRDDALGAVLIKYFLLGANDGFDEDERRRPARDVAMSWLARRSWPVYANTKNREAFEPGAQVVLYIGGKAPGAQTFLGTGVIARIRSATTTERNEVGAGEKTPARVLEFEPLAFFQNAVSIRPLLDQLEMFERVRQRWGIALVGGSRRISKHDFDLVLKAAKTVAKGVGGSV